jgi:hypothetical protein
MKDPKRSEVGVSEVIGSVLLLSMVVLGVSIIAVFLFSQPLPKNVPSLNAIIWNDSQNIYLRHDGGDIIYNDSVVIYVNGTDQTSNFFLTTDPAKKPWTNWSIGNVLQYAKGSSSVYSVRVVYGGSITLAST